MDDTIRHSILKFSQFLSDRGLNCFLKQGDIDEFGDFALQATNGRIAIDVLVDRSSWRVDVREVESRADVNYDPAILRDFFGGSGDDVLSVEDQIKIVEQYWTQLVGAFSAERRDVTHATVKKLKMERMKRRNPKLWEQVNKFT